MQSKIEQNNLDINLSESTRLAVVDPSQALFFEKNIPVIEEKIKRSFVYVPIEPQVTPLTSFVRSLHFIATDSALSAAKDSPRSSVSSSAMSFDSKERFREFDNADSVTATPIPTPKTALHLPLKNKPLVEQQRTAEHQRILAHESRNIRLSSISNLEDSQRDLYDAMVMIHNLLQDTESSPQVHARLKQALLKQESAYESQQLALACECYVDVINNYLLSPQFVEPFIINTCLNELLGMFSSECAAKKIDLRKMGHLLGEAEYLVSGRKAVLLYAIVNVLKNAIKFVVLSQRAAQITVALDALKGAAGYSVSIRDNGMGMTPDQVEHCFDGFDKKHHASIQGNGSGLSHIKQSLREAEGDITVSSEFTKGTTFKIIMPLTFLKKKENKVDYSLIHVLVVDDQFINLRLLMQQLIHIGLIKENIMTAQSKEAALELFIAKASTSQAFSFVLTDMRMPSPTDGLELIDSIRSYEKTENLKHKAKLIIISGNAPSVEDMDPRFDLADHTLVKGCENETIRSILSVHVDEINRNYLTSVLKTTLGEDAPSLVTKTIHEYYQTNTTEAINSARSTPFHMFAAKRRLSQIATSEAAASSSSMSPGFGGISEAD